MTTAPEPPPRLLVALVWAAASGELRELLTATETDLAACCTTSATAYRAAVILEGGPAGDTTVTEALLMELAAWLRALDADTSAALMQAANSTLVAAGTKEP